MDNLSFQEIAVMTPTPEETHYARPWRTSWSSWRRENAMIKLLRKDVMLNWTMLVWLLALVAGMAIYLSVGSAPPEELIAIVMLVASMLGMMIPAREDKFKAAAFSCSMPITRTRIMLARYLLPPILFPSSSP
jgi:hypothetical protein